MAWAVKQETDSPLSKLILLMIANYADEKGEAYPSQIHLAKLCQCTRISVNKHIKVLERNNFITIKKTRGGMYAYNTYHLNMGLVNNINLVSKESLPNTQDKQINKFDEFWALCPRKIAKKKTKLIYNKILKDKEVSEYALIKGMEQYKKSVDGTDVQFIVHPTTWLNQGRWEDEIITKHKHNKNWLAG